VASVGGGWLVSATGRYKVFAVTGLVVGVASFVGMAWAAAEAPGVWQMIVLLVWLGLSLGLVMPTLTVAIQNAVRPADMGSTTSAALYFRSLGGAIGVALAGAIMAVMLHRTGDRSLTDVGVQQLSALPAAEREGALAAYRSAIAATFVAGAVIAAVAFAVVLFLPERPLLSALTRDKGLME